MFRQFIAWDVWSCVGLNRSLFCFRKESCGMKPGRRILAVVVTGSAVFATMVMIVGACDRPWPDAWQAAKQVPMDDFPDVWPRPLLTLMLVPNARVVVSQAGEATFITKACCVGLAIEEFRIKQHRIPMAWEELVPDFLDRVPRDPFDGEFIRYQVWDGSYRLYSLGPNDIDDYGQGPKNEGEPGLDITFEVPKPLMNVVEGAGTAPPDDHVGE